MSEPCAILNSSINGELISTSKKGNFEHIDWCYPLPKWNSQVIFEPILILSNYRIEIRNNFIFCSVIPSFQLNDALFQRIYWFAFYFLKFLKRTKKNKNTPISHTIANTYFFSLLAYFLNTKLLFATISDSTFVKF